MGARPSEVFQIFLGEIPAVSEYRIKQWSAVSFRQDEPVASRPLRIPGNVVHDLVVESDNQLSRTKAASDMTGVCVVNHFENGTAYICRPRGKRFDNVFGNRGIENFA